MKTLLLAAAGALVFASAAGAKQEKCNWGQLTKAAIHGEFGSWDQGAHSSDPSGNGHGPDDPDQPRAGLANVAEKGNLHATCEFIEEALLPVPE